MGNRQYAGVTGDLTTAVNRQLAALQYGRIYRLATDPMFPELEPIAATDQERKLLRDCRHTHRLYAYRNHLVHEFREPGHGIEFSDDGSSPYYHGRTDEAARESWELVYPIGFFRLLAHRSLATLKTYLLQADLDPYACYHFGSPWR